MPHKIPRSRFKFLILKQTKINRFDRLRIIQTSYYDVTQTKMKTAAVQAIFSRTTATSFLLSTRSSGEKKRPPKKAESMSQLKHDKHILFDS